MKYSESERRRRGRRRKKNYFLNALIVIFVIAGMYYIAFHSGVFDIREFNVENNVHYTTGQVAELTGVETGDNIFMTRVADVAKRLEQDPYIRKAEVSWNLPRGLDIVLDERKESVLVRCDEGYAIVDYDGMILRMTKEELVKPIIVGLTPIDPEPGKALKAEEAGYLKPGLDFINFIENNNFYIKKIDFSGVVTRVYVFDKLIIEGELENMEKRIVEIRRIVADLDSQGIERGTISVGGGSCSFSPEVRN